MAGLNKTYPTSKENFKFFIIIYIEPEKIDSVYF